MTERARGVREGTLDHIISSANVKLVTPYAEMGMYPKEIAFALFWEKDLYSDNRSVGVIIGQARKRGDLRQLTPEELADIKKAYDDSSASPEKRVFNWLLTREVLRVDSNDAQMPNNRLEWKNAITKLEIAGILQKIKSATKPLILRKAPFSDLVKIYNPSSTDVLSFEEKSEEFVRGCLRKGIIGDDLSKWNALSKVYEALQRKLPGAFCDKVRLEILLAARLAIKKGDTSLFMLYQKIGEEIDSAWFCTSLVSYETFITEIIGDKDDSPKYGVDEHGAFRLDENRRKWREPVGSNDDGTIKYSDSLPSELPVRDSTTNPCIKRRSSYSSLA